jgi:hypothetical protein
MLSPEATVKCCAQERPGKADSAEQRDSRHDQLACGNASEQPEYGVSETEQTADMTLLSGASEEPRSAARSDGNEEGEDHATSFRRIARGLLFFALVIVVAASDSACLRRLFLIAVAQSSSFGYEMDVPTTELPSMIM